jgi:hypothetical protein
MIIANYTPDEVQWQHVGQIGILKPNDVEEFNDARGNHILNKWGARGLIRTKLHADVDEERAKAMKIYKNFWIRQVTIFNRQNEINKNERKAYVSPTPMLRQKAEELGIELIGSWTYTPPANDAKVTALEKEVSTLKGMLTEMVDAVKSLKEAPKLPIPTDTEKIIGEFRNMKLADFESWLIDHANVWQDYPQEVRDYAKQKYEKLNPGEEFILPE